MTSPSTNEDRISSLPEDVLSHILSLMPTIYSVRPCVLSKRWRYTWTLVTNLGFNDDQCVSEFVDRVLERCKTRQLNLFRLGLFRHVSQEKVSKWINDAIRLNVCELDIHIRPTQLPISLFTCKTLTKLRLDLGYDDLDVFNISSPVMLPRLKALDLRVCSKTFVNVFKFIHGCSVLESLSLMMKSHDIEQVFNFNMPTLKRLELTTLDLYYVFTIRKFVLNVPNLEYLFLGGELCPHFVMEDLSSLVEATVSFNMETDHCVILELLKGLSGVKSLSWFFRNFSYFSFSPIPKFPNSKHLELKDYFRSPWMVVIQILESSPELEHLSFNEPRESTWFKPRSVPTCTLSNLKTIRITECKGRKCDIRFLEFMLRNAKVLKTLTVICGDLHMKEEMELYDRLLKFPRASRFCEIHFVGKCINSIGN